MQAAAETAKLGYELYKGYEAGTLTALELAQGYKGLHNDEHRSLRVGQLLNINAERQANELKRFNQMAAKRQKMNPRYRGPKGPGAYAGTRGMAPSLAAMTRVGARAGYQRTAGLYGRFHNPAGVVQERGYHDVAVTGATLPATAIVLTNLCLIPQGATAITRTGQKTILHSLQIRGELELAPTVSSLMCGVAYMYVVQDRQCNGATAAVTDVLTDTLLPKAMINMANSSRFRIIKRIVIPMNPGGQNADDTAINRYILPVEYYTKLNIPVEFDGATGAVTEIKSNNLFLLVGASTLMDDKCAFTGTCRVRFSS